MATLGNYKKGIHMLELIYQDEYGQRNIVARDKSWQELEKKAKALVSSENFDNALNMADQRRDFTAYYVELFDSDENKLSAAYGGPKGHDGHQVLIFDEDGNVDSVEDAESVDVVPNFYIGQFNKSRDETDLEVFYVEGARHGVVNKFSAGEIERRGFYFIKE